MTGRSRTYKDCFPSRERLSCSSLGMRGTLWSLDLSRSLISVLVAILLILNEVLAFQNNGGSLSNFAFNQRPLKTCPMGHVLVEKPEGFKCMKDFSSRWRPAAQTTTTQRSWGNGFSGSHSGSSTRQPTTGFGFQEPDHSYGRIEYEKKSDDGSNDNRYHKNELLQKQSRKANGYPLPRSDYLTRKEEKCLAQKMVFWPADSQCYTLLHKGPCSDDEWLVLEEDGNGGVEIVCRERICPCKGKDPQLCEVWYDEDDACRENKCRVALAAEQQGICEEGEQLLVNPFGMGVCGCRSDPPHMKWADDGRCYELYTQGPCPENHTVQFSLPMEELLCVAEICPEGMTLYRDGRCYSLYTRGPCDDYSELVLDPSSKEPVCLPTQNHKVKRIFDLAPKNLREERERNSILGNLRVQMNSRVQEQKKNDRGSFSSLFEQRRKKSRYNKTTKMAIGFLEWLRSYKKVLRY